MILLSCYQARALRSAALSPHLCAGLQSGEGSPPKPLEIWTSVDLGLTQTRASLTDSGVLFAPGEQVTWQLLDRIAAEEHKVFRFEGGRLEQVQVYSETTGWVRTLCPTPKAPTVLVSGIPMHRIKGTDPVADTKSKLQAIGRLSGRVLDTATGLGYTAIEAAKAAEEVVTVELDPGALEIARWNPWSRELFERPNIRQVVGDTAEVVKQLESRAFSFVIHDPPTMSLGGELYSEAFYRELHRIMRVGGKLFHYIGDAGSSLGKRHFPGVMKRLQLAGFRKVKQAPEAFGVVAQL